MAQAWGNVVQHWQAYVNAYVVRENDTSATIRCETYFHSIKWGYSTYAEASASINGTTSHSGRFTASSGTGQSVNQHAVSREVTVSKRPNGYNVWCSGTVNLVGGYHNGSSTAGCNVWVGARKYKSAKPPRNFSATRNSDTNVKLTWQGDYTSAEGDYPWLNVYVDRRVDNGPWATIAKLGWDATSYSDGGVGANHHYQYRACANGHGGWSPFTSDQPHVYMTPAAPRSISLDKVGGTAASVIADTSNVMTATGYEVQKRLNGGDWTPAGTTSTFPFAVDVGGGTASVRVRSTRGDMRSAWAESGQITTITAPLAPAVSANGAVLPGGATIELRWIPNHQDGTSQTAAQVEVTKPNNSTSTLSFTTETNASIETDGNGIYLFRVRTKGLHADWGEWSTALTVTIAQPPSIVITSPANDRAIVKTLPLSVEWDASCPDGIASQTITLATKAGAQLFSKSIGGGVRSFEVSGAHGVVDKEGYVISVTAFSGTGLTVTAERQFETRYNGPAAPIIVSTDSGNLSTLISVAFGMSDDPTIPSTSSVSIARIDPDGTSADVASGLFDGEQVEDRLPPLNVECRYVATATSDIGTVTQSEIPYTLDSGGMEAFNFGPDASRCYALGLNAKSRESCKHGGETFRFATGPNTPHLPVFYADGSISADGSKGYVILSKDEFVRLKREARERTSGTCWYRDAWGNRAFCKCDMQFGYSADDYMLFEVDMDLMECVWEEPVNG